MQKTCPGARSARFSTTTTSRALRLRCDASSCLIVNTKGGGHAFIGFYLAKELLKKGHTVTLMNDGDKDKVSKKAPYSKYADLEKAGVKVAWGSPADPATWPQGKFDVVYDNNGKVGVPQRTHRTKVQRTPTLPTLPLQDMESCKPLIDGFAVRHSACMAQGGGGGGGGWSTARAGNVAPPVTPDGCVVQDCTARLLLGQPIIPSLACPRPAPTAILPCAPLSPDLSPPPFP